MQELEHTRKTFIKRGFLIGWKPNEMTYAERGKLLVRVPRGYRITIATRFVYPNLMTDLICHVGRQHELRQRGSSNHRHRRLLRARRVRPCHRSTAECGQQFPPSDGDCHMPLPCEVRKGNDTTPSACSLHVRGGRMLVASTSVSGFNCTTPAASSWRMPPSPPQAALLRKRLARVNF